MYDSKNSGKFSEYLSALGFFRSQFLHPRVLKWTIESIHYSGYMYFPDETLSGNSVSTLGKERELTSREALL